jgi:hypothetical protein
VQIFAISVDPPVVSNALRRHLGAEFIFLSDQDGELLDRLNIRHKNGYRKRDIAFPTAILADKNRIVRWVYEMEYGNVRMTPEELFEAIERMTLEEQNRELLRGRAVSQVVKQVFLMAKSADLAPVIQLMGKELKGLGFRFSFCGITIFDEDASVSRTYSTTADRASTSLETGTGDTASSLPPQLELPLSGLTSWSLSYRLGNKGRFSTTISTAPNSPTSSSSGAIAQGLSLPSVAWFTSPLCMERSLWEARSLTSSRRTTSVP